MSAQPLSTGDPDPLEPAGLGGARALLESGRVHEGMRLLVEELAAMRARLPPRAWRTWIAEDPELAALRSLVHEDPLSSRVFGRPRGCAAGAVAMDLVYGLVGPEPAGARAAAIHRFVTNGRAARAVRLRRQHLARLIDEAAASRAGARVLAVASGPLREAELSGALRQGRLGELVALEPDAQTAARVEKDYGALGVRAVHAPLGRLLAGAVPLGGFDLVYAAGLLDSLGARAGRRLVEVLFDAVRPDGRALLTSFLPGLPEAGYMEAMMRWRLVTRGEAELLALASGIERRRVSELSLSFADDGGLASLAIVRRRAPSVAALAAVDPGGSGNDRPERRGRVGG